MTKPRMQLKSHYDGAYGKYLNGLKTEVAQAAGRDFKQLSDEEIEKHLPYHAAGRIKYGAELACHTLTQSVPGCRSQLSMIVENRHVSDMEVEAAIGRPPWVAINTLLEAVGEIRTIELSRPES